MRVDLLLLAQLYLFSLLVACAFVFQRLRYRYRKRRGKKSLGFYPTATSLGNALHQLQSIAEPPVKYVIVETMHEDDLDEDDLQEQDSGDQHHLLRQAARIRRGERLERLTARMPRRR